MPLKPLLIIGLILASAPGTAQVYMWTDEKGRVHYSDKPRAGGTSESVIIEVQPAAEMPATEAAVPGASAIDSSLPKPARQPIDVVMYATKTCGYCARARSFFNQRGIRWQEIDIESSQAAREEFKRKGGQGVPLFFINGQRVRGFSEERMQAVVAEYGY